MAELKISDNLKSGKQEILLDPTKIVDKCGNEITALLANDLMVQKEDGSYLGLVAYIHELHGIERNNVAFITFD